MAFATPIKPYCINGTLTGGTDHIDFGGGTAVSLNIENTGNSAITIDFGGDNDPYILDADKYFSTSAGDCHYKHIYLTGGTSGGGTTTYTLFAGVVA